VTAPTRSFKPRVINPVKLQDVHVFSADENIRKAARALKTDMPWVGIRIHPGPSTVTGMASESPGVLLCDDTAAAVLDMSGIQRRNPALVTVLLTAVDFIQRSPPAAAAERYPYADRCDLVFAVDRRDCAPRKILPSVVRCAEDRINIERYSKARRYIFLVVDDEPRWFSQFLPVLYGIIGQRGDITLTRTYEETLDFLFGVSREEDIDPIQYKKRGHGDDVVCLITDIYFPRGRDNSRGAGLDLIRLIDSTYPRIPKIIASKAGEADDLADTAFILPKGDPGSLETLSRTIHDHAGLGDFIIRDDEGRERHRLRTIREILELVRRADQDTPQGRDLRKIMEHMGQRDCFSTWLYMHGFRDLGDRILPRHPRGKRMIHELKRHFEAEIAEVDATPLVIDGRTIHDLDQLLAALRTVDASKIRPIADVDTFSNWLDRKGYPELAKELRPMHGSGIRFEKKRADVIEKWIGKYRARRKG